MKILPTSGSLNKCVGQCINAAPKKKKKKRESRKPEEIGARGHGGGGVGGGTVYWIKEKVSVCKTRNSIITVPWQLFCWYKMGRRSHRGDG